MDLAGSEIAHALHEGEKLEATRTISRTPHEIFAFCRNVENLPQIIKNLDRVERIGMGHTKWFWHTDSGVELDWESEIIAEIEDRLISWQSLPGGDLDQAGSIWFHPLDEGSTEVHVQLRYAERSRSTGTLEELLGRGPDRILEEILESLSRKLA